MSQVHLYLKHAELLPKLRNPPSFHPRESQYHSSETQTTESVTDKEEEESRIKAYLWYFSEGEEK